LNEWIGKERRIPAKTRRPVDGVELQGGRSDEGHVRTAQQQANERDQLISTRVIPGKTDSSVERKMALSR